MDQIFTKEEAFSLVKSKFNVKNAEERMTTDRRALLDDIIVAFHECIPFQSISLLSVPPEERRAPTLEEIKSDFLSNTGGLCFSMNICGYFLLKALGFDVTMAHATCTTTVKFPNNHITLYLHNVEKRDDKFLVELAMGVPTFQAVSLDFEVESPVYVSSYLEYKYVKHGGKILRMHGKGCGFANRKRKENPDPELDFWIGDFRRFNEAEEESSTNLADFQTWSQEIFVNPVSSPFHTSYRLVIFLGKKAHALIDERLMYENDTGALETRVISGGDNGIIAAVKELCPTFPEDIARKALLHWRQVQALKTK